jgi:hypothetical protein
VKLFVVSCPPRASVLAECLAGVRASDWTHPVEVVLDVEVPENEGEAVPDRRSNRVIHEAILRGVQGGLPWFVLLEDDGEVNRHLQWNLERWEPLTSGLVGYGALTTNEGNKDVFHSGPGWYVPDSSRRYGLVGALLTRQFAAFALSRWDTVAANADITLARLGGSNRAGSFYVHWPSLVRHRHEISSVCGHGEIRTAGFDPDWRA